MANPCKQKRFVSHGGDVWGFARKYNIPLEKAAAIVADRSSSVFASQRSVELM